MMRIRKILAALLMLLTLVGMTGGCNLTPAIYSGSGTTVTRVFTLADFNDIRIEDAFQVEVTQSAAYSVSITVDDNLEDKLDIRQSDDTLHIGLKSGLYFGTNLRAKITLPALRRLDASGASHVTAVGFKSAAGFKSNVSGASSASLDMEAGEAEFDISGASRVEGNFRAGTLKATVSGASSISVMGGGKSLNGSASGASRLDLADFPIADAKVNLSGASSATITVSGRLDVNASGASTLVYSGSPSLGEYQISGGSKVERK